MDIVASWMDLMKSKDWRAPGGASALAGANGFTAPTPDRPDFAPWPAPPQGFKYTGAFRHPENEWFLDGSGKPFYAAGEIASSFPILEPVKVPAMQAQRAFDWKPTPPNGWTVTGRGMVPDNGYFMATGDRQVWQKGEGSGLGASFYAWLVEPTIKRPKVAPWFTLTNQYRVPKPGDWFLAKGAGPAAAENEPVKLGQLDVVPSGPRWILEYHKP